MSSHPEADALVRTCLAHPGDETPRLILADWLDDTGEPHNAAWAGYIRARAAADRHEGGDPEWQAADRAAGRYADHVIADLRIPVGDFLRDPDAVLRLVPAPNLNLRLAGHTVPRSVIELVPESVARENILLPIHGGNRRMLAASDDPTNWETVRKLEFILNTSVVLVGSPTDDVEAAINGHYGQTETECVDSISYIWPDLASEVGNDAHVAGRLFVGAFMHRSPGFEVLLQSGRGRVTFLPNARNEVFAEDIPLPAFTRLLHHLGELPVGRQVTADGLVRREVEVPAAVTDRFPIDFEVRDGEHPPRWLRVTYRWERKYPEPPPRRRRL